MRVISYMRHLSFSMMLFPVQSSATPNKIHAPGVHSAGSLRAEKATELACVCKPRYTADVLECIWVKQCDRNLYRPNLRSSRDNVVNRMSYITQKILQQVNALQIVCNMLGYTSI